MLGAKSHSHVGGEYPEQGEQTAMQSRKRTRGGGDDADVGDAALDDDGFGLSWWSGQNAAGCGCGRLGRRRRRRRRWWSRELLNDGEEKKKLRKKQQFESFWLMV